MSKQDHDIRWDEILKKTTREEYFESILQLKSLTLTVLVCPFVDNQKKETESAIRMKIDEPKLSC